MFLADEIQKKITKKIEITSIKLFPIIDLIYYLYDN